MIIDDTYGIKEKVEEIPQMPAENERNQIARLSQKSGWLKKQSNGLIKNWSYRYFALDGYKLYYFKLPSDKIPKGIINFNQISIDMIAKPRDLPKKITLKPANSTEKFLIKSSLKSELSEWASILYHTILTSRGKQKKLTGLSKKGKFWKLERISNTEFVDQADTGDILLFRSQDISSTIARGLIGSKYDHVAFIIKYVSGKIGILEATTADGVGIVFWNHYLEHDWHTLSERIMYRQLHVERTDEMMMKLEEFVKKVEGKKFKISPVKLLQRSSRELPGEEDSFFCSELVASAYKAMGLINQDIPASAYWPGDFSCDKNLDLIGAALSREILIDFDLE